MKIAANKLKYFRTSNNTNYFPMNSGMIRLCPISWKIVTKLISDKLILIVDNKLFIPVEVFILVAPISVLTFRLFEVEFNSTYRIRILQKCQCSICT